MKAGERPCIQGTVALEIITPGPGSLFHRIEMVSLPTLQRTSMKTKPESAGLPFLASPFISLLGREGTWV